ncbi:MAG: PEP-CTERM sorting domain-containing protein [Planctomycetota bacterium]
MRNLITSLILIAATFPFSTTSSADIVFEDFSGAMVGNSPSGAMIGTSGAVVIGANYTFNQTVGLPSLPSFITYEFNDSLETVNGSASLDNLNIPVIQTAGTGEALMSLTTLDINGNADTTLLNNVPLASFVALPANSLAGAIYGLEIRFTVVGGFGEFINVSFGAAGGSRFIANPEPTGSLLLGTVLLGVFARRRKT